MYGPWENMTTFPNEELIQRIERLEADLEKIQGFTGTVQRTPRKMFSPAVSAE